MSNERVLIVGCSYVENLDCVDPLNPNSQLDRTRLVLRGTSGAGNQAIAARTVYECSLENFDHVYILWSGINRLDFPIGRELHKVQPIGKHGYPKYPYFSELGEMVWYHSGGFRLSGTSDECPKWLQQFYDNQYKSATPRYLTDLSLLSIIQAQTFLDINQIPYSMSFIYDVHNNYRETYIEPGCGQIDTESSLFNLVNWKKFSAKIPPFEYARKNGKLEIDRFHPKFESMHQWFLNEFNLDLLAKN